MLKHDLIIYSSPYLSITTNIMWFSVRIGQYSGKTGSIKGKKYQLAGPRVCKTISIGGMDIVSSRDHTFYIHCIAAEEGWD